MQTRAILLSLWLLLIISSAARSLPSGVLKTPAARQNASNTKQLLAVRGEVVKIKNQGRGMLLITVRPPKDFAEVSVAARENDLVGAAAGGAGRADLVGLLAGDAREEETITAAELSEGDLVSVIYDPQLQNRAIEIYLR